MLLSTSYRITTTTNLRHISQNVTCTSTKRCPSTNVLSRNALLQLQVWSADLIASSFRPSHASMVSIHQRRSSNTMLVSTRDKTSTLRTLFVNWLPCSIREQRLTSPGANADFVERCSMYGCLLEMILYVFVSTLMALPMSKSVTLFRGKCLTTLMKHGFIQRNSS